MKLAFGFCIFLALASLGRSEDTSVALPDSVAKQAEPYLRSFSGHLQLTDAKPTKLTLAVAYVGGEVELPKPPPSDPRVMAPATGRHLTIPVRVTLKTDDGVLNEQLDASLVLMQLPGNQNPMVTLRGKIVAADIRGSLKPPFEELEKAFSAPGRPERSVNLWARWMQTGFQGSVLATSSQDGTSRGRRLGTWRAN